MLASKASNSSSSESKVMVLSQIVRILLPKSIKALVHLKIFRGGSPASIHGLFSGWYCGLTSRKVTLGVSMAWAKEVIFLRIRKLGGVARFLNSFDPRLFAYVESPIGMDWLSKRKFVIVCHEKVVRIPIKEGGILRVHGERTLGVAKALMNAKIDEPKLSGISVSKEEHEVHLKLVLESLRKDKLYVKFSKLGDALSRKERVKSRRVRGMILAAQSEAFKQENILTERLHDAAESVRDTIGFEYCLASSSGWTKSPILWAEIGESSLTGLELVQETIDKVVLVKEKPKTKRDHQKSYVNYRRKLLEFEVGDRPFEILEGLVAYRLRLPKELNSVHDTFHVSNLKKCLTDANLHVPLNEIKIDKTSRFVEEPIEIMDHEVKSLKCSRIPLVKVRWNSKRGPEFT
ncbi:hypothetical protein Tco_1431032 [Tanacetum coccineum]